MASEVDQASQQLLEEQQQQEPGLRNERQGILNLKQLKSFEILKSALTVFTSNTKFMFFMILSVIPLFVFMVFAEVKLQKAIDYVPHFLPRNSVVQMVYISDYAHSHNYRFEDEARKEREFFFDLVQVCVFYLVLYPLVEIFSMIITVRLTAKANAGEKQVTFREVLNQKINNNLKGLAITCLCVHLLSTLTLIGLLWIVANHCTLTRGFNISGYFFSEIEFCLYILSIVFHSVIFVALLYKYLDWSAFWNMGVVISVLEEETGIGALGMADYYGKHCRRTGFQLMLVFFVFGNVLRLPCLFVGLCNGSLGGVLVTTVVVGLFCLVNLVKWVAFVFYFYDCKHQTLEKKVDEEVGKP